MEDISLPIVERERTARQMEISLLDHQGVRIARLSGAEDTCHHLDASPTPIEWAIITDPGVQDSSLALQVAERIRGHSPGCFVLIAPPSRAGEMRTESALARALVDSLTTPSSDLALAVRLVMRTLMRRGALRCGTRIVQVMLLSLLGLARGEIQHVLSIAPSTLRTHLDQARHVLDLSGLHDVLHTALRESRTDIAGLLREFVAGDGAVSRALVLLQPAEPRPGSRRTMVRRLGDRRRESRR